jgi:hypothetical protein
LVKIGAEAEGQAVDVMEINRPDDLGDIADLGLTLAETKRLLARLQQEIVAAQVREHAARRPTCSRCGDACRVKDYRERLVATLFGQVTVRLPDFAVPPVAGSKLVLAKVMDRMSQSAPPRPRAARGPRLSFSLYFHARRIVTDWGSRVGPGLTRPPGYDTG